MGCGGGSRGHQRHNRHRSYELADHFRGRGVPVVLGGVHPTLVSEEVGLVAPRRGKVRGPRRLISAGWSVGALAAYELELSAVSFRDFGLALKRLYNCRYRKEVGGRELIGTSTDSRKLARGAVTLLILVALAASFSVGCGAGSGGSSSSSAERQVAKKADSSEQKAEGPGPSHEQLGHPALGSADAPVVMTEFSDYQ